VSGLRAIEEMRNAGARAAHLQPVTISGGSHMNSDRRTARGAAALCLGALAAMPLAAQAQAAADSWQFRASIYGYFPTVSSSSQFPTGGSGPTIDVDVGEIVDALKFTFMGSFEAQKGKWGVFTDLIYLDLGATKTESRDFSIGGAGVPAGVTANLSMDLKSWVWTVAGLYSLSETQHNRTNLVFGARMVDLKETLDWGLNGDIGPIGLPGRGGRAELSQTNWDAIVGLKGLATLGTERRWVVPYYVDIGTGQSKLTWQALAGVGYSFDWGTVTAAWRHLEYDFDSDKNVKDIQFSGPFFGLTFRW
jgi:hypothetical protein